MGSLYFHPPSSACVCPQAFLMRRNTRYSKVYRPLTASTRPKTFCPWLQQPAKPVSYSVFYNRNYRLLPALVLDRYISRTFSFFYFLFQEAGSPLFYIMRLIASKEALLCWFSENAAWNEWGTKTQISPNIIPNRSIVSDDIPKWEGIWQIDNQSVNHRCLFRHEIWWGRINNNGDRRSSLRMDKKILRYISGETVQDRHGI